MALLTSFECNYDIVPHQKYRVCGMSSPLSAMDLCFEKKKKRKRRKERKKFLSHYASFTNYGARSLLSEPRHAPLIVSCPAGMRGGCLDNSTIIISQFGKMFALSASTMLCTTHFDNDDFTLTRSLSSLGHYLKVKQQSINSPHLAALRASGSIPVQVLQHGPKYD